MTLDWGRISHVDRHLLAFTLDMLELYWSFVNLDMHVMFVVDDYL